MPGSFPDTRTLGSRLAAYAFLANDPSVPMVAADWWEISGPHYNAVAAALAHFVAGEPAAEDLRRFAASPGDRELETALVNALLPLLDRSPADRARLGELVVAADARVLVDYHNGALTDRSAAEVSVADASAWSRPRTPRTPGMSGAPGAPGASGASGAQTVVVIPFRDRVGGARTRNLLACLAALRDQDGRDARVSVTVVESDSAPTWRDTVEPLVDHYVFARHDGHFNKSWAVNVGVRDTPGEPELICVLDTDILADRRFLSRNLDRMAREPELSAFLPYRRMFCLDPESSAAAVRRRCERGEADVPLDAVRALVLKEPPGACLWVRRTTFDAIGGFDERYQGWGGEDDDVVARLSLAGGFTRFDDPLLHLAHPRPEMTLGGVPFNAHIAPLSWNVAGGYGDLRGPRA
ncbi:galactosyltransferase-related protein [Streptosporangium sp. NPDC050280]|uniref:galactosyltransferase-related protein n=1 Tax=unclassified Streptosporangium TaxID=2632669 RepID=UPI003437F50B